MTDWLIRMRNVRLLRYLAACVGALAMDMAVFLSFMVTLSPALASAFGYTAGIAAHWVLSSRAVFADTLAGAGAQRHRQKFLFAISALIGLFVTTVIVGAADRIGVAPLAGKGVAVAASFAVVWLLRSRIVFRAPSR